MTKVIKIIARILGGVLEWGLILFIFFAFSIRFSFFQTFVAKQVTAYLSSKLDREIRVDKIDIVLFDRVYFDGLYIEDSHRDTLASIGSLRIDLGNFYPSFSNIHIESITLREGVVKLIKYEGEEEFNFHYLVDFFKSDKPKKQSAEMPLITIDEVVLDGVNFSYNIHDKPAILNGVDYAHLNLSHIKLRATHFSNPNGHLKATIHTLKAKDVSGFELLNFTGIADVSADSLHVKNLHIKTPKTKAELPYFTLHTRNYSNFKEFVDSVDFRAELVNSVVSMTDVAYFAPALWGMNQEVWLNAKVSRKIKNLFIQNLHLETGQETIIKGDVKLPDFRNLDYEIIDEKIDYFQTSTSDLRAFRLPDKEGQKRYVTMTPQLNSLGLVQIDEFRLFGVKDDFTVALKEARADVGTVQLPYGVQFTYHNAEDMYYFNRSAYSEYDVRIVSFDLAKFINRKDFGKLQGDFFLSGKGLTAETFELTAIEGEVRRFDFLNYVYENISIKSGTLKDNKFDGSVLVQDKNLVLQYDGSVEFGRVQKMDFLVTISKAELDQLKFVSIDSTSFTAVLEVHLEGFGIDDFEGIIDLREIKYKQGKRSFEVEDLIVKTRRTPTSDTMKINSSIFDATVIGKLNFSDFFQSFRNQFATIFPSFLNLSREELVPIHEDFGYEILIKKTQPIFDVILPGFSLAPNSVIGGKYNGESNFFDLNFTSDMVKYNEVELHDVTLIHDVKDGRIFAQYDIEFLKINDSLDFQQINFSSNGTNNTLNSLLTWGEETSTKNGQINWLTTLASPDDYIVSIESGRFFMKNQLWRFADTAYLYYAPYNIVVENFTLEHSFQYISLGGCISNNPEDKLEFFINDFQLADINALFGGKIEIQGLLNGRGYINDAFNSMGIFGDLGVDKLEVDRNQLGDLNLNSFYDNVNKKFDLNGTLFYKGNESIGFEGHYYVEKEDDNVEARLVFDKTDISFVNAFFDDKVVSNIRGLLTGKLALEGTLKEPKVNGRIRLSNSGAKIGILGTDYKISGDIIADEYGFLIPNIPITDEEGNTGSIVGSVFHENFKDWNFDVSINMETDGIKRDPLEPWKPVPLNRFMVLNTIYKEGEPYYGKAYVTGTANIFGYLNNLEVSVNTKTERGTWINFPMYGRGDIKDDGFITFVSKDDSLVISEKEKIDFTGVKLNLNFDVRDNARIKIIFNENLGDEITATGSGPMSIKLDEYNELSIEGTYRVKEGEYNFAMGPIKKNFYIEEGGTVQWTGNPYDANLNLRTYYLVNANISEVVNDFIESDRTGVKDVIYCYLELKESLEKPLITFDLAAPKAPESGKATINRIKGDKDELNRQFFSLLLFRKFQPIRGQNTTANNAALEIVSNQINSILDQVSQDYKLSVKLDSDQFTQESSYEFGVSKGFLEDRLVVTGSFGVNQVRAGQEDGAASNFIGDVNLEYKLNTSGTFRVNIFNESNQYNVIQNKNLGLFTQGVGLHYQESFRNIEDFKLVQFGLDVFRPVDRRRFLGQRKNQETPIPETILIQNKGTIEDEENSDSK